MKKYLILIILLITLSASFADARPHFSIGINLPIVSTSYCGPRYTYPCYYPSYSLPCTPAYTPVYVPSYVQATPALPPPAPVYLPSPAPIYHSPSENITVIQVQTALKQKRYYNGIVDGIQGPATTSAIRTYQTDRNLTPSGRIDSLLLNDLGL